MPATILALSFWRSAVLFVAVAAGLVAMGLLGALWTWLKLHRLGTPLPLRQYLALRWRGVDVPAIAAAHWSARQQDQDVPMELWISLAVLHVDIVRVAAALGQAATVGVQTTAGVLGAAGLAGFDPVEVVDAARQRDLPTLTSQHLTELEDWGLQRRAGRK